MALPFAGADALTEGSHLVEHGMDFGDHVFAVDDNGGVPGSTEGNVKDGAVFGDVDLLAAEHGADAFVQARFLRELHQQLERLVRYPIF